MGKLARKGGSSKTVNSVKNPLHASGGEGGTILSFQNPLQGDVLPDGGGSPRAPPVGDADAGDTPDGKTKSGFISTTIHHLEEVVIKDAHAVEGIVKKDLKQIEHLLPDDLKLIGDVGAALAGASAEAASEAAKAMTDMSLNAFEALKGKEHAKVERAFRRIDVDGSGFLEPDEVKLLLHQLGKDVTDKFVECIFNKMDPDGDGEVSLEEFKDWWVSEGYNQSLLGDSVGMLKDLGSAPILIFYHLFDESTEWFDTLGEAGPPLAHLSNIITWSLNVLQVVWSAAAICESVRSMSADPNRNPQSWEFWSTLWWWVNMVCAFLFLSEWVCKFFGAVVSGNIKTFAADKMLFLDLLTNFSGLTIVFGLKVDLSSYTFTYADSGTSIDLRWLRIVRLSRVLKTIRNERINNLAPVVWQILENSAIALMIPAFVLIIMVQVCASLFYYWEHPASVTCELPGGERVSDWVPTMNMNPGCQTEYHCACAGTVIYLHKNWITGEVFELTDKQAENVFDAWWWALVTVTTVGYGDVSPITALGQMLGAFTGFVGLLIVAMPITIVGKSFHDAHADMAHRIAKQNRARAEKRALHQKLKQQKKDRAELKRKGLLVKQKSTDIPKGADSKLARNADLYAGDRQDVLMYLSMVSEKVKKLEADLTSGQSPVAGPQSGISQLCDSIEAIQTQVLEVWPAERLHKPLTQSFDPASLE